MYDFLARLATRRAGLMVVGALIVAGIAIALGGPVGQVLTGGNPDFVTPGSGSVRADERIERATGTVADGGVLALVQLDGPVDSAAATRRVAEVAAAMRREPAFARVLTYPSTRDPSLLSRDGRSTLVIGQLRAGADDEFQPAVRRLTERFDDDPGVALGGSEVVGSEVVATVQHDLARAELLAFPVLFLLSLWIFRSLLASALPLVIGGLNIVLTLLGLRVVNEFTDLSVFSLNLATALGLGLAIDYSLLIVSRFRSEQAAGASLDAAVTTTLHTAGRTIVFSSLTVCTAMASLFLFQQRFLYSMAVAGLLVAIFGALVGLLVLPAMLRLLGPRLDLFTPPRWRRSLEQPEGTSGGWFTVARVVMRGAPLVALAAAGLIAVLTMPFLKTEFTTVGAKDLPTSAGSRQVDDALRAGFDANPAAALQVVVPAPASAEAVRAEILRLPGVRSASPVVPLDATTALIQVTPAGTGTGDDTQDLVREIRALPGGVLVGGETARFIDLKESLVERLPEAIALVCATSFVLLALMSAAVVLPLVAVLMNLLTLAATFGILTWIFQDGHLGGLLGHDPQHALDATQPVLLFALVFGLSTDYGVFLFARMKEARDAGAPPREAVLVGVGRTGRIVTAAAILFCVALGALAISQIVFIKELGVGTALGVLLDATIVRALLVPSLMRMLGRAAWWGPRPLRWTHERFGLREGGPVPETVVSQRRGAELPAPDRAIDRAIERQR